MISLARSFGRSAGQIVSFGNYLKTAFLNRWNLLAFLGSAGFALLTPEVGLFLPLVLAGEVAYVGLLSANSKFQRYVDAQAAKASRAEGSLDNERTLERITRSLPRELLNRFETLRTQCLELRQIAMALKHPGAGDLPLDKFQVSGLDRLLWIHLRLLYTQYALSLFLQKTNEAEITANIKQLEARLAKLPISGDDLQAQRIRKALQDNLETSRSRLANLAKARDNYELVKLQIERLENKIRSLSEMAVNRQEPDFISGQVDQVASSMLETERTMNELQFATGLDSMEEEAPELLRSKATQTQ